MLLEVDHSMTWFVSSLRDASQLWRAAPEIVDVMNAGKAKTLPKGWSFENYGWKLD